VTQFVDSQSVKDVIAFGLGERASFPIGSEQNAPSNLL
jgi:hypothetical protein